jgi:hypothetical protein
MALVLPSSKLQMMKLECYPMKVQHTHDEALFVFWKIIQSDLDPDTRYIKCTVENIWICLKQVPQPWKAVWCQWNRYWRRKKSWFTKPMKNGWSHHTPLLQIIWQQKFQRHHAHEHPWIQE